MDFEAWERDHELITEFGYSLVRWEGPAGERREVQEHAHLIVEENRPYTNHVYMKGYRDVCVIPYVLALWLTI